MYLLMDTFSMNNKSDDELFDLIYGPVQSEDAISNFLKNFFY
jgi:hypothetical protein